MDVKTPLPFVVPLAGLNVQLVPTEQDGVTVAPLMPLPNWSFTVAVRSDAVPPPVVHEALHAVIGLLPAVNVDALRLTLPGLTVTAAVWVSVPDPVTAALIVFPWATVDEKAAENTPPPLVVPEAEGVNVFPVPVDDNVTVLPLMTLPN